MLDHERLDVDPTSIGFVAIALGLVETLPRGFLDEGKRLLVRVVEMLSKMCR